MGILFKAEPNAIGYSRGKASVPVFFLVIGMFTFFGAIISLYSE
jgi:hypothetical protein